MIISTIETDPTIWKLDSLQPKSLSIDCETIVLNKKDLEISFNLESVKIKNFDRIIINGVVFVKENLRE